MHRPCRLLLTVALVSALLPVASRGQADPAPSDPPPPADDRATIADEIQVTATRRELDTSAVPVPMSVVDRDAIARRQASTPGELFAREPGVEVEGSGPFLGLPVIRGMAGNRVLVLVDGERLNNSREAINFGGVQPSLVEVGQLERMEILRGPASVLYGSDAIGGIVNLVTREAPVPSAGLALAGGLRSRYGSAGDERSLGADVSLASPRWSLFLDGAGREADDYDSPAGPVAHSGAATEAFHGEVAYRPAPGHAVELDAQSFTGEDIGVPGTGGVFTGSYPWTERDKLRLAYEGTAIAPFVDQLRASVYHQRQEESFATVLDLPPIPAGPYHLSIDTESERIGRVDTIGLDVRALAAAGERHLVTYGLEVFRDDVDETRREVSTLTFAPRFPGPPPFTATEVDDRPTTPEATFQGVGLYVQDEISWSRLTLVPGLRYDRFDITSRELEREEGVLAAEDRSSEALSGSLAALVRLDDRWSLAATLGRAFRTPNVIERYFFGPGSQGGLAVPNPDLDDETSLNLDVGFKLRTAGARAAVTVFRNEVDDLITFVPGTYLGQPTFGGQPVTTLANVAEARIEGIEAQGELVREWRGARWRLYGNAAWTRAENLSGGDPLFVSPLSAVAGVDWTARSGHLQAGVSARHVAGQDRVPEGFEPTASFTVVDLRSAVALGPLVGHDVRLRLGVENLLDAAYTEPYGAVLEPERSWIVSLDVPFGARR